MHLSQRLCCLNTNALKVAWNHLYSELSDTLGLFPEWPTDCVCTTCDSGGGWRALKILLSSQEWRITEHAPRGAHSMGIWALVPFGLWSWCLFLVTLHCCGASSKLNRSTDSSAQRELNVRFAAASSQPAETISVFTLDYDYVQIPYEVTLWILLASLAKIGKGPECLTWFGKLFSMWDNVYENKCLVDGGSSGF